MSRLFKINAVDCKQRINFLSKADKEALKKQLEEYKV